MHARSKRILILGTGPAQADAIRCSKGLGCEVHAVASKPEGPGLPLADHFEGIDIVDRRRVLAYAKRSACDAVYSVGSDIAMPTVAYVAEAMGLRCPLTLSAAERLQNKERLRNFLKTSSLSPLHFAAVGRAEDPPDWSKFPAIVKPVDSQGGRGVRRTSELTFAVVQIDNEAPSRASPSFSTITTLSSQCEALTEYRLASSRLALGLTR